VDRERQYMPGDALKLLKEMPPAKFDETVEVSFRLGVDPRKAEQMVRGTVSLPHGTGRSVRVAAFAVGDKAREAREAGADVVGGEELVEEVLKGNMDFDAAVATPDLMPAVGKAGRVLGPRGLMPNPKAGTVTPDIGKAVREIKAGKLEYRVDRTSGPGRELPGRRGRDPAGQAVHGQGQVRQDGHPVHHHGSGDPPRSVPAPRSRIDVRLTPKWPTTAGVLPTIG
jgi:hypothetical protein